MEPFSRSDKKQSPKARNRCRFSIGIRQETTRSNNKTLESLDRNVKKIHKRNIGKTCYSDKQIQDHEKVQTFKHAKSKLHQKTEDEATKEARKLVPTWKEQRASKKLKMEDKIWECLLTSKRKNANKSNVAGRNAKLQAPKMPNDAATQRKQKRKQKQRAERAEKRSYEKDKRRETVSGFSKSK
ncbi:uncharacterized protein LOC130981037 [Arachis stenosperma]|uniref:uncharacterized protein LOC130981037 n=1 Tax=Arachis stenosperma TaxID=217475 RepID=UPI0025AB5F50|nr:uncharacterized protein LOC130981037 [Arachis stenosperma]